MKTLDYIIRVSKMGDRLVAAESTMTVEDQRRAAREAIEAVDGRVGKEHLALDVSGHIAAKSPQYRAAVERVRRGEVQGLAVAYGDRFMRNWRMAGTFYDELEQLGAEILFAGMPGIDYRTPLGRQMTGMQAVAAEVTYYTNKERGERIADGTVARGVPNRVPFGYKRNGTFVDGVLASKVDPEKDGKALVPDSETAPLLVRIFEMRADGYSWASIGRWLEAEEVTPPRGGSWAISTLRNIIANETYRGVVQLGKRRIEDAHEPLVSRSLWKAAQSSRTLQRNGKNAAGLAGGLLVCANCGRRLSVTGTQNPSYTCRRQLGGKCEHPVYVSKRRADADVEKWVVLALQGEGDGPFTVAGMATSRDIGRLRKRLSDAKAELEEYVVAARALDADLFKRGLDSRHEQLRLAHEALDEALSEAEEAAELPDARGWDALDLDRKRQVARALIDFVAVEDAEAAARELSEGPSRGPSANVENRLDIYWRGEYRQSYPPGLSPR